MANENFLASFEKLAEHSATGAVREFGGVFAFVTGHPVPLFNGCVVSDEATPAQLEEALGWVRERRVPCRAWIAERLVGELGAVAQQAGLERHPVPYPNLVLHPVPVSPPTSPGVTVAQVSGDEFVDTSVEPGSDASWRRRSTRRTSCETPTSAWSSAGSTAGGRATPWRSGVAR
jgi:hypothetical protein